MYSAFSKHNILFFVVCFFTTNILILVLFPMAAFACTGFYAGRDVTEDGTTYLARSNDCKGTAPNYVTIYERVENTPGRTMPIDVKETHYVEIAPTTYKYTATPFQDSTRVYPDKDYGLDTATCSNEYGVSCTATVTTFSNSKIFSIDPLVQNGIAEVSLSNFLICQSATAREGVELLFDTIDQYGSGEVFSILIADNDETWYVEVYSGHTYSAVLLPTDGVAVYGNEFNTEYVSDYSDFIISDNLENVAKSAGTAVYGKNNELNLLKSYASEYVEYSHLRTWMGHKFFASSTTPVNYSTNDNYTFIFRPDNKVKLTDVFNLYRNRFDGLEYSPECGRNNTRVIGSEVQRSVHVNQIYDNLPQEMSVVTWECLAPALGGIFVPISNFTSEVTSAYGLNQPADEVGKFDTDTYPWYAFKEITTIGVDQYFSYLKPVQQYWEEAESMIVDSMTQVIKNVQDNYNGYNSLFVQDYLNKYEGDVQTLAFNDAKYILNKLRWTISNNSNSFKVGRNPETHEATDKVISPNPVEIDLDNSDYGNCPEFNQSYYIIAVVAVVVAIILVVVVTMLIDYKNKLKNSNLKK